MAAIPEGCIVPEGYIPWHEAVVHLEIGLRLDNSRCEELLNQAITWDQSIRSWLPEPPFSGFSLYPVRVLAYVHAGDLETYIERLNGKHPSNLPKLPCGSPRKADYDAYYPAILQIYRQYGPPAPEHGEGWATKADVARMIEAGAEREKKAISWSTSKRWAGKLLKRAERDCQGS